MVSLMNKALHTHMPFFLSLINSLGRVLSFSDCFIIICLRRNPANSIKPIHSKKDGAESHGAKVFSQPGCRRLRLSDYASRVTESCTVSTNSLRARKQ